jgi:hypothetical protein
MKRLTLAFLGILGLMLASTSMMYAYADVQLPANMKFKCHALGSCFVLYGFAKGWGQDPPLWVGSASGSIELSGHAEAAYYEDLPPEWEAVSNMYGSAYFTASGGVKARGFLFLKWFENDELHQLVVAIYSKPLSQGVFQPETDKFLAGSPSTPSGWEELMHGYSGVYKIGSHVQYLSGPIAILASRIENSPYAGLEYIVFSLWFGKGESQYILTAYWYSETVNIPVDPPITIPAAKILVRDVKLL